MRPVPETLEALRLMAADGDVRAVEDLSLAVQRLAALVPDLAAYSLTLVGRAVTLTYEGSRVTRLAHVERVQPADGDDPLDESLWQATAQADAAPGVRSTLSLPIVLDDTVLGCVTLYGAESDTFDGRHHELATAAGAWEAGAVTNADLSFATRSAASLAPGVLAEERTIERAVTQLVRTNGVSRDVARHKMREAAQRAGIPVVVLARLVLEDGPG